MSSRPLTLQQAQSRYPHRFTMEHVPQWARQVRRDGTYYAPQYRSDAEWFERTVFPGEPRHIPAHKRDTSCMSLAQTWPLGQALPAPFHPT